MYTLSLMIELKRALENIVEDGENNDNQLFLLFFLYYLPFKQQVYSCETK